MESIYKILEHFSSVIYFVGTLSKMVFLAGIKYEHEQPRLWQKTLHCVHECVHVCVCVCVCVCVFMCACVCMCVAKEFSLLT